MAITFIPAAGDVLMCEFGPDPSSIAEPGIMRGPLSVPPEIYKLRQCAVLFAFANIAIVVPLSTSAPKPIKPYHVLISAGTYAFLTGKKDTWMKANLIQSVSHDRLDRCMIGGKYERTKLSKAHLKALRIACLNALQMGKLAQYL